jgi:hypothetical protein
MPDGSVQAISTSAATILSLGLGFLGLWAWGPQATRPWASKDALVLVPFVIAFACLGLVPWMATETGGLSSARTWYLVGACLLFAGMIISFLVSLTDTD